MKHRSETGSSQAVWLPFIIIAAVNFVLRAGYFAYPVIDWDESTFILMGQDILNGHLPYLHLWDIKPPFLFYMFAGLISISGDSFLILRALGTLLITASCWLVYLMLRRYTLSAMLALLGATITAVVVSRPFLHVSSEHLVLLPMLAATYLLMQKPGSGYAIVLAGILLSCACFTRINLAFTAIAAGLYICALGYQQCRWKGLIKNGLLLSAGFSVVFMLLLLPYILNGSTGVFFRSVFTASLSYAEGKYTLYHVVRDQLSSLSESGMKSMLFAGGFAGAAYILIFRVKKVPQLALPAMILVALELSVFKGGRWFSHYLIQMVPLLSFCLLVLAAAIIRQMPAARLVQPLTALAGMAVFLTATAGTILHRPEEIVRKNAEIRELENYLRPRMTESSSLALFDYHIMYWMLHKPVFRPSLTHPSNIFKPYLLRYMPDTLPVPDQELKSLINQKPEYILLRKDLMSRITAIKPELDSRYRPVLTLHYTTLYRVEDSEKTGAGSTGEQRLTPGATDRTDEENP